MQPSGDGQRHHYAGVLTQVSHSQLSSYTPLIGGLESLIGCQPPAATQSKLRIPTGPLPLVSEILLPWARTKLTVKCIKQ